MIQLERHFLLMLSTLYENICWKRYVYDPIVYIKIDAMSMFFNKSSIGVTEILD